MRSELPCSWLRLPALALTLLTALPARATDYFVSAAGDDAADGRAAQAQGGHGPLATLQAAGRLPLRGGDRLLLRCGDRFTGPLKLVLPVQGAGDFALKGYGSCSAASRPVIDGRVPLPARGNGEVQRFDIATPVVQVYAGAQALPMARFPERGYLIVPANTPPVRDSLPALMALAGRELTGATLRARTEEWLIEERGVTSESGRLDKPLEYALRPRSGFYLVGKEWMLGGAPAFISDATTRRLSLRAPEGAALAQVPAGTLVEISSRGTFGVGVTGLVLEAAGGDALLVHVEGPVRVAGNLVTHAWGNGISVAGAALAEVESNTVADAGLDGLFFAEVRRAVVRGNRITDAGLWAGPRPSLAAINAHRTNSAVIEKNVVDGAAYHGIRFSGDAQVHGNIVARACRLLSDCAGLYTWRRGPDDVRPHSDVSGNVVFDVQGDTSVKLGVNDWFTGIYLDDHSNDVTVTGNVVVGANQGIYLHNAWANDVRGNVVRAALKTLIDASDPKRVPRVLQAPNRLADNDERQGRFSVVLRTRERAQAERIAADENLELQIEPADASGAAPDRVRRCATINVLQGRAVAGRPVAFGAVRDCD